MPLPDLRHQRLTMKRDLIPWFLRAGFLRGKPRHPVLFAGPWVGEFGWELMNWQGLVRALAPRYEKVLVCSRDSSQALYEDPRIDFRPHRLKGTADHIRLIGVENPDELARVEAMATSEMDRLRPLPYVPLSAQAFIRFGQRLDPAPADVLVHARGRTAVAGRNWPEASWLELCSLLRAAGLRVACIGLRGATLDLPGIADFRDVPLGRTMDILASARMVVGPSSGPLHLASLCGCPHVVWTNRGIYRMGKTSREKYERWWNPLGTPVQVLEQTDFQAEPREVAAAVLDLLERC